MLVTESLTTVVAGGDRRKSLEALRARLAAELEVAEGRDVAPLAGKLMAVIDAIDAIPDAREGSVVDREADEVAAQREKRRRKNAEGL